MSIEFNQRPETYLLKERYDAPKDVFIFFKELLERSELGQSDSALSLTDFGCATGELLYFLKNEYPQAQLTGIDNSHDLLSKASQSEFLEGIRFVNANALSYLSEKQDVVTCFGMLGIFDDFEELFESLIKNTRKGGRIYIHGLFNDDDIDVRVYYKDKKNDCDWNRGFNIFSCETISQFLKSKGLDWTFHDFEMSTELKKNQDYPHRAYTETLGSGKKVTVNGLCLILPEKILEIVC